MDATEHLRVQGQRTRARLVNQPATLSLEQWEQTLSDFNGMCAYCSERLFDVLEHFLPVAVAGTTVKNCVPACYECNHKKRDYVGDQLIELFGSDIIVRIQTYLDEREAGISDHPARFKAQRPVLQDKDIYTINELIECLPCKLTKLYRVAKVNQALVQHIRSGQRTREHNAEKLLSGLSEIYGRPLSIKNVTGLNVMVNKRVEAKERKSGQSQPAGEAA